MLAKWATYLVLLQKLHKSEFRIIRPGSISMWDMQETGILKWRDGKKWPFSFQIGNFRIFRESGIGSNPKWADEAMLL